MDNYGEAIEIFLRGELEEAVQLFEQGAEEGDVNSMLALAHYYRGGDTDGKSVTWLSRAAKAGNGQAAFLLGNRFLRGDGVTQCVGLAYSYFNQSAQAGDCEGMVALGDCFLYGEAVQKDASTALKWYDKAAKKGHGDAYAALGMCYLLGEGVETDEVTAAQWFRRGADKRHERCMRELARCYRYGLGVEQSDDEEKYWWDLAQGLNELTAEEEEKEEIASPVYKLRTRWSMTGDDEDEGLTDDTLKPTAMPGLDKQFTTDGGERAYTLAGKYLIGERREQDYDVAVYWLMVAANQGHKKAMLDLADCYEAGLGVIADGKEAAKWRKAAAKIKG